MFGRPFRSQSTSAGVAVFAVLLLVEPVERVELAELRQFISNRDPLVSKLRVECVYQAMNCFFLNVECVYQAMEIFFLNVECVYHPTGFFSPM